MSADCVNSFASGRWGSNFKSMIFKCIVWNNSLGIYCENAFRWMPPYLLDN